MKSKWSIVKYTIKSGRVRFEGRCDGVYLGRFDTHEDAWAAILEKCPGLAGVNDEVAPCQN